MPDRFNMSYVMISYQRKDQNFVERLAEGIKKTGREVWVDLEDIPKTADWWEEIKAGIEGADAFLFVISPTSIESRVCRQEIDHALENNKRIIPLLYKSVTPDAMESKMHPIIAATNWLFWDNDNKATSFKSIITALNLDLGYRQQHTRILVLANEWDDNTRHDSLLLRGDDLKKAEDWLSTSYNKQPAPTDIHIDYINESRKAADRLRRLAGIFGTLLILILGALSLVAFIQSRAATENFNALVAANGDLEMQETRLSEINVTVTQAELLAATAATGVVVANQTQVAAQSTQVAAETLGADAVIGQETADAAQQTAVVNQHAAETAQAQAQSNQQTAEADQATALSNQQTAQAEQATALAAQQTSEAGRSTAQADAQTAEAGEATSSAARQTAVAAQSTADAAAHVANTQQAEAVSLQQTAEAAEALAQQDAQAAQQAANDAQQSADSASTQAANAQQSANNALTEAANAEFLAATQQSAAQTAAANAQTQAAIALTEQANAELAVANALAQEERALSLQLASDALIALDTGEYSLAVSLILLAVDRPNALQPPETFVANALLEIANTSGIRHQSTGTLLSVAYSPDGDHFVIGDHEGFLIFNDRTALDGQNYYFFYVVYGYGEDVIYTPNQEYFATVNQSWGVNLWTDNSLPVLTDDTVSLNHDGIGEQIVFDPTGSFIITTGVMERLEINGAEESPYHLLSTQLFSAAFNPQWGSERVLTGGLDGIAVRDTRTGDIIGNPWSSEQATSLAFSSDGAYVVSGSTNGLQLWYSTGESIGNPVGSNIEAVSFSPDGQYVASAGSNGLQLWALFPYMHLVDTYPGDMVDLAYSPDGIHLVGGGQNEWVSWYPTTPFTSSGTVILTEYNQTIDYNGDGTILLSANQDGIAFWDTATGNQIGTSWATNVINSAIALSPDGQYVARILVDANNDNCVKIWRTSTREAVGGATCNGFNFNQYYYDEMLREFEYSPDGNYVIVTGYESLSIWDGHTGELIQELPARGLGTSIVFNNIGTRMAVLFKNVRNQNDRDPIRLHDEIVLFDTSTWDIIVENLVEVPSSNLDAEIAISPLNQQIISGGDVYHNDINFLQVWDGEIIEFSDTWVGQSSPLASLAFSPDGNYLITLDSNGQFYMWDAISGQILGQSWYYPANLVRFNPGGRQFASTGDQGIYLWDFQAWDEQVEFLCNQRYALPLNQTQLARYNLLSDYDCGNDVSTGFVSISPLAMSGTNTIVSPNPTPVPSIVPPLVDHMDDGALDWSGNGWFLAESANFNGIGQGWVTNSGVGQTYLTFEHRIDLSVAQRPQLRFLGLITAESSTPTIEVRLDNGYWMRHNTTFHTTGTWMPHTVDLSMYSGHIIEIRFAWDSPTSSGDIWLLDDVSLVDLANPQAEIASATPLSTVELTPAVTQTPTIEIMMTASPTEDMIQPQLTPEVTAPVLTVLPYTPTATTLPFTFTPSSTATTVPVSTATYTLSPSPSPTLTYTLQPPITISDTPLPLATATNTETIP